MNFNAEKSEGFCKMTIEGEMNIYHAAELKKAIFENFADSTAIELDLLQVTEMDTSGFQIIYLLKRESDASNKQFRITKQSEAVTAVINLYNLASHFN
ncbi:MAG: STAS domain-containing protein [Nitrospirae bacterium]|nr:STAS domain-containing protein [Nitrospirota bacterium]